MSWQLARKEAESRLAALGLPDGPLDGFKVNLIDYDCEESMRLVQGSEVGLNWHRMVNTALRRMLNKRGADVVINTLNKDALIAQQ